MPHVTPSQAASKLASTGHLSKAAAEVFSRSQRAVSVAEIGRSFEDPTFACILIDVSPSMGSLRDAVITGQNEYLGVLRGSSKCKKKALYLSQQTFNEQVSTLNEYSLLNKDGGDGVVALTTSSYVPSGTGTALYKAVFGALEDIVANMHYGLQNHTVSKFSLSVITDGKDNQGGVDPAEIRSLVTDLREKGALFSSLVLGIKSDSLPESSIIDIKNTLGFGEHTVIEQGPAEIRRAFNLASKSALG